MEATIPLPSNPPAFARCGFPDLRCPLCGTAEETQSLDLGDLQTFRCAGCDETYTVDDIRQLVSSWQLVLSWIDSAPLTTLEQ